MNKLFQIFLLIATCFSFSDAYGLALSDEMVKMYQGRMAMAFGTETPMEVYIFTDWNSQDSLKLEPLLETMAPELIKKAKIYFMNKEQADTENLTIANLSILASNPKELSQYFKIRKALVQLAAKKKNPSVDDIKAALLTMNLNYNPLQKELSDILVKVNKGTTMSLDVTQYPTVVIYNIETSAQKRFTALGDITQANVMKEVEALKAKPAPADSPTEK